MVGAPDIVQMAWKLGSPVVSGDGAPEIAVGHINTS